MSTNERLAATAEAIAEESRRVRRLRMVVNMALGIIAQGDLPYEEAAELTSATRRLALQLFPGKDATYDLIYQPKFRRLIREVYRVQ
jgi:hypothetical protein